MNDATVHIPHDNYRLFSHDIAIEVLHVFMGYVPNVEASLKGQPSYGEGFILVLARLYAVIFIILSCMSDNWRDTTGGHCQRLSLDIFTLALLTAIKIIEIIAGYVQKWAQLDFEPAVWRGNSEVYIGSDLEATNKVHSPRTAYQLLAVKEYILGASITTDIRNIHDFCIAELDSSTGTLRMLGDAHYSVDDFDCDEDIVVRADIEA